MASPSARDARPLAPRPRHRRRRLPRLAPVRAPARRGLRGDRASTTCSPAAWTTSQPLLGHPRFSLRALRRHQLPATSPGRSTRSCTSRRPASPADFERLPIQILKVGSLGTHKALGLAKAKGARFLLASTSECYGDPEVNPQPESYWGNVNPVGIRGVYDEAKRFAEAMTMAYHRHHGVDVRIVRIFNTFGPRMQRRRRPRDPELLPPGAARRAARRCSATARRRARSCYVDDLVEGIWRLLRSRLRRAREHRQPGRDVAAARWRETIVALSRQRERDRVPRRCRPTTRRCAGPTSSLAQRVLEAGSRAVPVEEGAARARATTSRSALARERRGRAMTDRRGSATSASSRTSTTARARWPIACSTPPSTLTDAREARPVPRQDGPRARARHHDQGADRAHALHARRTATSTS